MKKIPVKSCCRMVTVAGIAVLSVFAARATGEGKEKIPLQEDMTFYCDFGDGLTARIAKGAGAPFKIDGSAELRPGRFAGKSLLLGGESAIVSYAAQGNIDMLSPGSISFWLKPVDWLDHEEVDERGYLFIFRLIRAYSPDSAASVVVGRMGFRKERNRKDRMFAMANNFPEMKGTSVVSSVDSMEWDADRWRLTVVGWQKGSLFISIDGEPLRQVQLPRNLTAEDVTGGREKLWFLLGSRSGETTLIDELAIYSRLLGDEDIKVLWKQRPINLP